ncbi:DUF6084 family protein [Nonomuraea cavernae]|uniref:Uncharacterized protein n=1 Tax=Nonomuraea cavernae TaxID=2045107 RepID=A0A918DPG4_9ACTN|nr:DUF6084 family protein [Nonomuraea cavernae]MCA2188878.1 DUF6084 family protein [Nonomuraea cavernae]GGO78514.1 hypothetical protein GCM10012289_60670 [Nonomuraea cavernae]
MTSGPPDLRITVDEARVAEFAALPTLEFGLTIDGADGVEVRSVVLDTQIRIAATRRTYGGADQARLAELFGAPEQWGRSLTSLLWTRTVTHLPAFTGGTTAAIPVPCTYDFEVAAAKYFHGLEDGEIPLEFLFSGTVFYLADGLLQAARIAWDTEAEFRMPVRVWKDLMDHYFPASAWLRLGRDAFDRLYAYRSSHTLAGWDDVVESLLRTGGS